MHTTLALAAILGAILIGAMCPGPSFVLVARTAVALSRRNGLAAALGMGLGGMIFALLALLGLYAVLARVDWVYRALKLAGGLYLLYIALKMWRSAAQPLTFAADATIEGGPGPGAANPRQSWSSALLTQLSNPKTAVAYGGIFAALLPQHPPLWAQAALLPLVFMVEAGWYSVVAVGFSSARPRAAYLRAKRWIDRCAGGVVSLLGLKLVIEAARS
jgi:threonine/homoserine/homoserine lactone efflux protein